MIAGTGFLSGFGSPGMDTNGLERQIKRFADDVVRDGNAIQFSVNEVTILCLTDENHDRMRFVAEITNAQDLTPAQKNAMLEANFHSALDARYATSHGVVYAAFIHPLSPLTPQQVRSGAIQVANLKLTFGTTYSSGDLSFGG